MSFRLPSAQKQYDDYCSLDPAFIQPPSPPAEGASDSERESFKAAAEEYLAKLTAAKETGDWSALRIDGQTPTKFVLGQVDRNVWRAIMDRAVLPGDSPRSIGQITLHSLLFRLALKSIVGLGDVKVERAPDHNWEGWVMAQADIVTQLDEIDPRIVGEIGAGVFKRLQGIRPLT